MVNYYEKNTQYVEVDPRVELVEIIFYFTDWGKVQGFPNWILDMKRVPVLRRFFKFFWTGKHLRKLSHGGVI